MWHRVAALLGGRTVEEWQAVMSSAEFEVWCALYAIEPWGYEADTWRMAVLAATTANYSGNVRKPLDVADFIPGIDRTRPKQTPEQMRRAIKTMTERDDD